MNPDSVFEKIQVAFNRLGQIWDNALASSQTIPHAICEVHLYMQQFVALTSTEYSNHDSLTRSQVEEFIQACEIYDQKLFLLQMWFRQIDLLTLSECIEFYTFIQSTKEIDLCLKKHVAVLLWSKLRDQTQYALAA